MGLGKNALYPVKIVSSQALSANYNSPQIAVQYLDNVYFTVKWSGTPTGTFAVQGSGDGGLSWQNITIAPTPVASGAPDTAGIEINQAPMPLLRVAYTRTSGTGLLDIWVTAKALG